MRDQNLPAHYPMDAQFLSMNTYSPIERVLI